MHDIDARIREISGTNNYMEHLQKVTGDIFRVDMDMWRDKNSRICTADKNVMKLLSQIKGADSGINKTYDDFKKIHETLSLSSKSFTEKVKKSNKTGKTKTRIIITPGYTPKELVNTPWFKQITSIENSIQKYFSEMFCDESSEKDKNDHAKTDFMHVSYSDLEDIYSKHPELVEVKKCLNCTVNNAKILQSFVLMKRACKDIINILLLPMYDVEGTINSHWNQIDRIFKNKTFQQHAQGVTPSDVIRILHQFIIAKYRADITGNNKHYVKLFFGAVGDDTISNMDGARFMEIMDSIDLSAFDKDDKVYRFATSAKTIMQKIAQNEALTPKMLEEITQMMNGDGSLMKDMMNGAEGESSKSVKSKGKKKGNTKQKNTEKTVLKEETKEITDEDAELMLLDKDLEM